MNINLPFAACRKREFQNSVLFDLSYNKRSHIVKNYIMWQVVSKYLDSMPDEFGEAKSQFVEAVAEKSEYQRWSTCVERLMPFMDMTMARMFVEAHFDENTKSTVKSSYSLLLH